MKKKKEDKKKQIKKLKELEEKAQDLEDKWKRALADYQNLERRIATERDDFICFANAKLIDKLLSVLDDLERAEKHLKDQGLTMAINQLRSVLETEGVEEIKVGNKEFDAEAVIVISNKKLTWQVVYGLESRGIPAYGAIWDS